MQNNQSVYLYLRYEQIQTPDVEMRLEAVYNILFKEIIRIEMEKNGQKLLSNS